MNNVVHVFNSPLPWLRDSLYAIRFVGRSFIFVGSRLTIAQIIISAVIICTDVEKSALDAYLERRSS